jgi:APA family basic amino acid/polyamine antiporter
LDEQRLRRQLRLPAVFAISIAPMLASGVFLLPSLVYGKVGNAAPLVYLVAGLLLIPALLSKAELSTAMPRAGGTYFFLDRALGPMVGTVAGLGTWLAMAFKSAFDLVGLGAYSSLFLDFSFRPVALAICVLLVVVNIAGVRHVARIQVLMVAAVLGVMTWFVAEGLFHAESSRLVPFWTTDADAFLASVGIVFVGFTGLTKVASISEEIDRLERTIPLAMIYALGIATLVYVLVMYVLIGVSDPDGLTGTLTPVAYAAGRFTGRIGVLAFVTAAILAFVSSANAGLAAASRYPFAMGRDDMAPEVFRRLGRFHTPTNAILLTAALMMVFILVLSPVGIAKLASAFQLMVFGLVSLAVIVMRESRIPSYDPGFRSWGYPWVQIVGILTPVVLIPQLGLMPLLSSGALVALAILWYIYYARDRVARTGALYHLFQRMGRAATPQLDQELRQILREKGLRRRDAFENSVVRAGVLRHREGESYWDLLARAAASFSERLEVPADSILAALSSSSRLGETPIGRHVALPHARVDFVKSPELTIVHSVSGVWVEGSDEPIYALFILIGPTEDPGRHLRYLAELANRAEAIDFGGSWRELDTDERIRGLFLRSGGVLEVDVRDTLLAGRTIGELRMHERCLIAMIIREGRMIVPHGSTPLEVGDRLTLVGEAEAVEDMRRFFEGV